MATPSSGEQWFPFHFAVALVRQHRPGSIGKSEALVKAAAASGEVRSVERWAEDFSQRHGSRVKKIILLNKDDLLYWLDQHADGKTVPASPPRKQRNQVKRTAARAVALALWGPDGPPAHLENKIICREIRAEFKNRGEEMPIDDATILRAVGRKK
jgi:hypothetical protein